jgi:hypothetical protein
LARGPLKEYENRFLQGGFLQKEAAFFKIAIACAANRYNANSLKIARFLLKFNQVSFASRKMVSCGGALFSTI